MPSWPEPTGDGGRALIELACGTVDYLRVAVGPDRPAADWHPCAALIDDPAALAALVRSTAAGRGTTRDSVAMSLFVQGYAFRIASIAIGAWLVGGAVLDVDPATTAISLGRHRPNGVHLAGPSLVAASAAGATVGDLHANLVDGHLGRLVATARVACRVGRELLWSNVGASCAASFGAFMDPLPQRQAEIRHQAQAFFAAARAELAGSGRLVPVGPRWAWERSACCLWYQTDSGFKCEDCSLWSPAERQARYDRIRAGASR
jgi:ferric iron reductase protein FhuF